MIIEMAREKELKKKIKELEKELLDLNEVTSEIMRQLSKLNIELEQIITAKNYLTEGQL